MIWGFGEPSISGGFDLLVVERVASEVILGFFLSLQGGLLDFLHGAQFAVTSGQHVVFASQCLVFGALHNFRGVQQFFVDTHLPNHVLPGARRRSYEQYVSNDTRHLHLSRTPSAPSTAVLHCGRRWWDLSAWNPSCHCQLYPEHQLCALVLCCIEYCSFGVS